MDEQGPGEVASECRYTVALCTHNHAAQLGETLDALRQIDPPLGSWELLIIDNASTDDTLRLLSAQQWPADWTVRVVHEEKLGVANARNRALAEAAGSYVVFIDDDETPAADWLTAYEKFTEEKQPDAVGGRIEVVFEDGRPDWITDELLGFLGRLDRGNGPRQLEDPGEPLYTGNFCVRRDVAEAIGGFDAALGRRGTANEGGEDVDFYRRLVGQGKVVWWLPDAVIYHRIRASKLKRRYFLDLHFRQGRLEGGRRGEGQGGIPPLYVYGQLLRAVKAAMSTRWAEGSANSLRKEMNVAYFIGYVLGWAGLGGFDESGR